MTRTVTLRGEVIAEVVKGFPGGRLKAITYGRYGELLRVEWHDDPNEEHHHREEVVRTERDAQAGAEDSAKPPSRAEASD